MTSDGTYNYTYDDEGNRLTRTKISDSSLTEYTWDHRNRLTKVVERATGAGGAITKQSDYKYDLFDRRISKSVDADGAGGGSPVVSRFVYDGDNIALQFDGSNNLTHRYLHGPAVDQILADEDSSNNILCPLTDNLGTVRDLVNDSGTVQNHLKYDSFGKVTAESNAAIDHLFAYTGRERDEETGLQFHRARYYDPATARWLSEDPIGFIAGDINLSRYVANNAPNHVDPTGLQEEEVPGDYMIDNPEDYFIWTDVVNEAQTGTIEADAPNQKPLQAGDIPTYVNPNQSQLDNYPIAEAVVYAGVAFVSAFELLFAPPVAGVLLPSVATSGRAAGAASIRMRIPRTAAPAAPIARALPKPQLPPFAPTRAAPTLPQYVTGGKTSGVLRFGGTDVPLMSGYKGPSASMPKGTPGMNNRIKSHVEAHAAAIMRQQGLTEATLYINRVPCPGKTGCDAMLPRMLPERARLRIVGPDGFEKVYIGLPD
jgi:RHS repeat-associated protein